MVWLGLATALLLWSAFAARSKRLDAVAVLSVLCILALTIGAVRVYPPRHETVALVAGTFAAALVLWLSGSIKSHARWAALCIGVAAGLFSLFGPAQGLFP